MFRSVFLISAALCISLLKMQAYASDNFQNVEDILVYEHGWQRDQIGPTGLSYTIDIDAQNRSILTLHPMIQQRTAAKVSTPICSLLKKGRQFYFSGTVRNGYSENKALNARKRYILQGESAVNDADWLQIDKYNWISYINEGLYSHQSCTPNQPCGHVADKYYDLPFTIQSCHATNLIAQSGSLTFSFPHLILTMPEFLYLSASKRSSGQTSQNDKNDTLANSLKRMEEMAITAGKQMAPGLERLFNRPDFSLQDKNRFMKQMYGGNIEPQHLIMVGEICGMIGPEDCEQLFLEAFNYGNMAEYFTVMEQMLRQ